MGRLPSVRTIQVKTDQKPTVSTKPEIEGNALEDTDSDGTEEESDTESDTEEFETEESDLEDIDTKKNFLKDIPLPFINQKHMVFISDEEKQRRKMMTRAEVKSRVVSKYDAQLVGYRPITDLDFSSSSEISDNEDEVFHIDLYAQEIVMKSYAPLYKKHVDRMNEYYRKEFKENVSQFSPRRYQTFNFSPTFPDPLVPQPLKVNDSVCMAQSSHGDMFPCLVQRFTSSNMLPRDNFYTLIDSNIRTKDCSMLSNFPYLEDLDTVEKLCLDLRDLYVDGAHGEHRGWGLPINDVLLYFLLEDILEFWKGTNFRMRCIYRAIHKLFPNKMLTSHLRHVFPVLRKRFKHLKKAAKGIDTSETKCSVSSEAFNPEESTDIIILNNIPVCSTTENKYLDEIRACGPDCYKMEEDYDERQVHFSHSCICKATLNPFEGKAQTTFEMLLRIERYSPCRVSEIMSCFYPKQKRTCREILIMAKSMARREVEDTSLHLYPKRKKAEEGLGPHLGLDIEAQKLKRDPEVLLRRCKQERKFKVDVSSDGEYGCFILTEAKKGEMIGCYTGEIISNREANRRLRVYVEFNQNFMLKVNRSYWLDAKRTGNVLRFARHSKTANCMHKSVRRGGGVYTVEIYVKNDLKCGDEITLERI